jgi:formylglycine-generating enzyme required for sulfatase activity
MTLAGSFPPNALGLHDILGNVREWTADCWSENLAGLPTNGSARTSGDCLCRALRGGSWYCDPRLTRSASRVVNPSIYRDVFFDFRVARTL